MTPRGCDSDSSKMTREHHYFAEVWYGLIMHFCDSNHEITQSSKRKYNDIKDH